MKQTMFERMGGFARIRLIVSEFYDRVLESEVLRRHFEQVDMRRLVDHQTKFIAALTGGPASFTNDHLARAHANLGITRDEYDEMTELLCETLEDFDLGAVDVEAMRARLRSLREVIVAAGPVAAR